MFFRQKIALDGSSDTRTDMRSDTMDRHVGSSYGPCWDLRSQVHVSHSPSRHRRLADGNVHCAGSATYQICFRLPIPNPNPKINKKNDTGMKLNIPIHFDGQ